MPVVPASAALGRRPARRAAPLTPLRAPDSTDASDGLLSQRWGLASLPYGTPETLQGVIVFGGIVRPRTARRPPAYSNRTPPLTGSAGAVAGRAGRGRVPRSALRAN